MLKRLFRFYYLLILCAVAALSLLHEQAFHLYGACFGAISAVRPSPAIYLLIVFVLLLLLKVIRVLLSSERTLFLGRGRLSPGEWVDLLAMSGAVGFIHYAYAVLLDLNRAERFALYLFLWLAASWIVELVRRIHWPFFRAL